MFANDLQKSKVIRVLLATINLERFWSESEIAPGPTPEGVAKMNKINSALPSLLSSGERVLLQVAFDLWNGASYATLWEIMNNLDRNIIQAIGELVTAVGGSDDKRVLAWLDAWTGYRLYDAPHGFTVG